MQTTSVRKGERLFDHLAYRPTCEKFLQFDEFFNMVDDISEARDISGRSEGPTANLTESKTDENLWYVKQKLSFFGLLFYVGVDLREILPFFITGPQCCQKCKPVEIHSYQPPKIFSF